MSTRVESLRLILQEPLAYLHPQRLSLPSMFDSPSSRAALNRLLLSGLGLQGQWLETVGTAPWTELWLKHWRLLPGIAGLLGAHECWPRLARGASMQVLTPAQRAFARCSIGGRSSNAGEGKVSLVDVEAAGLNALLGWREKLPEVLIQRLPLQFSPETVDVQRSMAAMKPDASLFILAVQHARIHSKLN
jgi:type III secretion system OrgA/MxiK family protein